MTKIREVVTDENGSAIIEFIMLALPLFIPLALFMSNVQSDASVQYQSRNLARQIARIYVTSRTDSEGIQRVNILKDIFSQEVFGRSASIQNPELLIQCSNYPCITPGSRVQVNIVVRRTDGRVLANVSATEVVDIWKSS